MSRISYKTLSNALVEFIPSAHANDPDLSKNAKEVKDRPLVFMVRRLTREDRLNLRSLTSFDKRVTDGEETYVPTNAGAAVRYIFENCVVEAKNVLLDDGAHESLKGQRKNELFDTEGIDEELMEVIKFVQDISSFTEDEAKN